MKRFYLLVFLCSFFSAFDVLVANDVVVKGTVKYDNGLAAANQQITIAVVTVSGAAACTQEHVVLTNKDGFYTDQLTCSSDIRKVSVSFKNCDGQPVVQVKEVPASHIVETNLSVCVAAVCVARFTSVAGAGLSFKFNSSGAEAGPGDVITERIWKFGEGDPLTGNVVDPTHTYKSPGTYEVCLTIRSAKGCSGTVCSKVSIASACKADFTFAQANTGIKFNSNVSTVSANDQITGRTWNFGDGSPVATTVDPTHTYATPGIYTVCLAIKTSGNCESKTCKQVTVMPGTQDAPVKLISLYPVPVHNEMNTVIWSRNKNVNAELAVYNLDGEKKWSTSVQLQEGNNTIKVPADVLRRLPAGSYLFKVTTTYGVENRQFFKL